MSSIDEQDLIQRSQQGQVEAFTPLVQVYQTQVYNLALRMLSDPGAAEDIAQETFLSAFHHLRSFHGGNFRAWLLRIAANACRDYLRSARVRRSVSLEAMLENPTFAPQTATESPEEFTLRREVAEAIQGGLGALPPDQRLALVLVDVQGLRYEEAAEVMGVPVGTVKSRL
ncbi:MAG: sigma-70 family RNA polymerase sigma factor, partial [Chloroflexi bacterium]|nr:sigma-70 family RNA polymerase sigma factor [Chloroflexota bacterium]